MKIRVLACEDDAVSSVLGVVLMVAVTIVLAAVIGTFVLGIGQDLTDPSPQVTFEYGMDVNEDPGENSSVVILHTSGDQFDSGDVEVTIGGDLAYVNGQARDPPYTANRNWPLQVTSGDRLELEDSGSEIETGDMVRIYWVSGEHAAIIGERRVS